MSELKRKREEEQEEQEDYNEGVVTQAGVSSHPAPLSPSSLSCSANTSENAPPSGDVVPTTELAIPVDGVALVSAGAGAVAEPLSTILICGEELPLKDTGGRKKRKHPLETLVLLAYKGRLAELCKANDMVSALEVYREMKSKSIKQDLATHLMMLAVCGGSPGEKDELDPGNGDSGASAARNALAVTSDSADEVATAGGAEAKESGSAQQNASAAADAALQIFENASKDGSVHLPESAFTGVIRACCLDGRVDKAKEVFESLKRAGGRPRLRTYAPLLEAYASLEGRLQDCVDVWREAVSPPHQLTMTEREYLFLVQACTRAKDHKCFYDVMTEYMEDVLQPRSRRTWDVLKTWFKVAPAEAAAGEREKETEESVHSKEEEAVLSAPQANGDCCAAGVQGEGGTTHDSNAVPSLMATSNAEQTDSATVPTAAAEPAAADVVVEAARPEDEQKKAKPLLAVVSAEEVPNEASPVRAATDGIGGTISEEENQEQINGDHGNMVNQKRYQAHEQSCASVVTTTEVTTGNDSSRVEDVGPCPAGALLAQPGPVPLGSTGEVKAAGGSSEVEREGEGESKRGFYGWKVSECKVAADGTCQSCGEVLRSIELSADDEQRLLKQVEELVCTNEQRTKQWEGYTGWLKRRGRDRYNVIIDGANVGYFKKNAADAGELADLKQVDWAVKKYEDEGKKPLVVLHSRHLVEKRLSEESKEILKRWREAGTIQSCAPKNNDDWYWLFAAVYAGGRVLVLTNDEMRDHHFSMLSHRSFGRWKERHQTRFVFGEWDEDMREVLVEEPSVYSKRTQRGEGCWHFPLEGSTDWLCVTRQARR